MPSSAQGAARPPRSFGVVIADVNEHVRDALASAIDAHPGLYVAGVATDGDTTAHLCALHRPDVAVLDVMPSTLHGHAHHAIRVLSPDTIVAIFTARADRRTQQRLLASGVHAVFDKAAIGNLTDQLHTLVEPAQPSVAI